MHSTPRNRTSTGGTRKFREEFDSVLKWWFDRGVDGFRIDVAHGLVKADPIPRGEVSELGNGGRTVESTRSAEVYRRWRGIANAYEPERYLIGEVWVADPRSFRHYTAEDELHQAFAFDFLVQPWIADGCAAPSTRASDSHPKPGPAWTWRITMCTEQSLATAGAVD